MLIDINSTLKAAPVTQAWIRQTAEKTYGLISSMKKLKSCYPAPPKAELSILIVGDKKMRALNLCYRKKDRTTDVLSFPQVEPCNSRAKTSAECQLGDIVINMRQAQRQARQRAVSVKQELSWLIVHGMLHLAGYDHEKSEKADAEMRSLEQKILAAI